MKGETEMINEHEKLLKDDVIPRITTLEEWKATAIKQIDEFNRELVDFRQQIQQTNINVQDVKQTVTQYGQANATVTQKLLDHVLDIKDVQEKNEATFKMAQLKSNEKVIVKRFSTKEKIVGTLFGAGGLAGIIAAVIQIWQ